MKIYPVISISTLANKNRTYLYNEMFDFAKRHNIKAEFGRDYFELSSVPDNLTKELDKLEIKYKKTDQT